MRLDEHVRISGDANEGARAAAEESAANLVDLVKSDGARRLADMSVSFAAAG